MNDHCDEMSVWRMTYWKCLRAVQLLACEGYSVKFLHAFGPYPFCMQTLQTLQPTNYIVK